MISFQASLQMIRNCGMILSWVAHLMASKYGVSLLWIFHHKFKINSQRIQKGTLMHILPWERHNHRGANFILPDCKPHVFQQIAEEVEFLRILFSLAQRLTLSLHYHYAICSFMCQKTQIPGTYISTLETEFLSQTWRLLKRRPIFSFNLIMWK